MDLKKITKEVIATNSSDLHLHVGRPPIIRLPNGKLDSLANVKPLSIEDVKRIINDVTTFRQRESFKRNQELDFSYRVSDLHRFRINIYEEQKGPAIALRLIAENIPSLEDLGIENMKGWLEQFSSGLVLVTGATGMGKTTTLASIIEYYNTTRKSHIITIEDPIEFVHTPKESLITQRELGVHTHSFSNAIRAALRQDPDIVMVGEMRDLETITAAITLAETGHLVFSTLHTIDAAQTINRIIDVFPPEQQQQIRIQLASTLRAVISQSLIPRIDTNGRVAAREIMLGNDAVKNCISIGKTSQIYSIIQINAAQGMISMDRSLVDLCKAGLISEEEAFARAKDIESLNAYLSI